jgi:TPR repeat protein
MSNFKIEDHEDLTCLAISYLHGDGLPRNRSKAVELFRAAAEQGSSRAMLQLAIIYHAGHAVNNKDDASAPIEQDLAQAAYWFEKCAHQGNAYAQYSIGYAYNYGFGVRIDCEKAAYWYLKAAQTGFTAAQRELGTMLLNGVGIKEDRKAARYWLERSYNKGREVVQAA